MILRCSSLFLLNKITWLFCFMFTPEVSAQTSDFQRQSRDFSDAVRKAGKPVQLLVGEGYNHFEIIETLANPYGILGRSVLKQMKLG